MVQNTTLCRNIILEQVQWHTYGDLTHHTRSHPHSQFNKMGEVQQRLMQLTKGIHKVSLIFLILICTWGGFHSYSNVNGYSTNCDYHFNTYLAHLTTIKTRDLLPRVLLAVHLILLHSNSCLGLSYIMHKFNSAQEVAAMCMKRAVFLNRIVS